MKIYIMPDSMHPGRAKSLHKLASIARPQIHTISENPEIADIIIMTPTHENFTDPYLNRFIDKHLHKCYVISQSDEPLFILAGLYASGNKHFWLHKHLIRGCPYIYNLYKVNGIWNKSVDLSRDIDTEKKYLFSFIGASSSSIRKRLLKLTFQRSDILIRCTNNYSHWNVNQQNREVMQKSYANTIQNSKFVLCPRGAGSGSIRLYEVMKAGVPPIIISDNWLPPNGPDWKSFALFVKESELKNIVEIVESHASEYKERGYLARKAWEEYFSDTIAFNQCLETIKDLKAKRIAILDRVIFRSYPVLLTIYNLKRAIRKNIKNIILIFFDGLKGCRTKIRTRS